jgi:hypothetical protein
LLIVRRNYDSTWTLLIDLNIPLNTKGSRATYLNSLAKEALPFMYQTSIEGIRNVLKECWNIYTVENNKEIMVS